MTPEQMQQAMNQWAQTAIVGTPFWMKALFVLQVLSMLTTTVCLPLITWKLYFGNKSAEATSLSPEQKAASADTRPAGSPATFVHPVIFPQQRRCSEEN